MGTSLHNFIGIFNSSFIVNGEDVKLRRIVIPIIQRDYAQGRLDPEVGRVRTRFLDSLHQGIVDNPIILDFVYGDIKDDGVMTPLDGQQRLTTLFLLHWYAAKKEEINAAEYTFLVNFSYETRYSAREFCLLLIRFTPSFEKAISEEIVDQSWFPLDWKKDPTISSMLVMIDAISNTFSDIHDIWSRLNSNAITFYFLPIKDMGLTDELYIKMNSRGKPLTQYEHFKAEFEHELNKVDEATTKRIIRKIDLDWTDMLWRYRGDDNATDDEFLRYFKFICDVICYQNCDTPQGKSNDEFDLMKKYFSENTENVCDNVKTLEKFFDCWCKFKGENTPDQFLAGIISNVHEVDKIKVENRYSINIFEDCLRNYADIYGNGNRRFPLNRIVMLYAIISYLLVKDSVTAGQFSSRLRIVNNLVQNSENEISDSEQRSSGNRMPAILKQVDSIIRTGKIDDSIEKNFNQGQLNEEAEKIVWLEEHPDLAEELFVLEDHDLLYGQISIVGLDHPEYFKRFNTLFCCKKDAIDCALISIGDYSQSERNGWRYQIGSQTANAWRALFHQSANSGFEKTKEVLENLLSRSETITDDLLMDITNSYITDCENSASFDWRYYYIKYDIFRPGSYGKYFWENRCDKPYEFIVMKTEQKISENSYQPFLKSADDKNISKDYYGDRLIIGSTYIMCDNCSFVFKDNETDAEINRINIAQNENGIDIEDRIMKLRDALSRDELIRRMTSNAGQLKHPYKEI